MNIIDNIGDFYVHLAMENSTICSYCGEMTTKWYYCLNCEAQICVDCVNCGVDCVNCDGKLKQ